MMKILSLGEEQQTTEPIKILSTPNPESSLQSALRIGTGLASKALKTAVDIPTNVAKTVGGLGNLSIAGVNKLTSSLGLPEQEYLETENIPKLSSYIVKPLEKGLLPERYTKPRGEIEKKAHEFVSDVTSLMIPLGTSMKLGKAAAVAGAGGLSKWASQRIGAGEGTQEGVKLGTMLATSLLGPSNIKNYMKDSYKLAEEALPQEGAFVAAHNLEKNIASLEKTFSHGEMTPSKAFMRDRINAIKGKIKDDKINIKDVWELKRNINEHIHELSKPYGVEKQLPVLTRSLNEILGEYGSQNTSFGKAFHTAEDVFKGINKASSVNAFLQKHVSADKIGKITAGMLLGYISPQTTASLVGSSLAVREGVKIFERFKNSPEIQKYYAKIVSSAAHKNLATMNKYVKEMDNYITDRYPENRS